MALSFYSLPWYWVNRSSRSKLWRKIYGSEPNLMKISGFWMCPGSVMVSDTEASGDESYSGVIPWQKHFSPAWISNKNWNGWREVKGWAPLKGWLGPRSPTLCFHLLLKHNRGNMKRFASFSLSAAAKHKLWEATKRWPSAPSLLQPLKNTLPLFSFSQKLSQKLLSAGSGRSGPVWKWLHKFKLLAPCPHLGRRLWALTWAEPVSSIPLSG